MYVVRSLLCAALVAGCGRVGFDVDRDAMTASDTAADTVFSPRICDRYPQALYCNDFEDGIGELVNFGGAITDAGGFGDSVGLTFTVTPGDMPRAIHTLATAIESGPLYVAGRLWMAPGPFIGDYLVVAQTTSPNASTKISFDMVDDDKPQIVNDVGNQGGRQAPSGSFPRDRWFCFELMIDVSTASARGVTLSFDGREVISAWQGVSTLPAGGWARVEIGAFASTANTAPVTVTFDNWVVQTAPIGCP